MEAKRHIRLGLFVVAGIAVLVAVLFLLGGRNLFRPTLTFETYFDESVAGLDVGAPVRFRGVPVGRVSEIMTSTVAYESEVPLDERKEYIVVRAKLTFSAAEIERMERDADQLVERGLRAQTQLAGITGQQYLSIDYLDPEQHPPLEFQWAPEYTYVPSAPSRAGEIVAHAQEFLASLNAADVKSLGQNLNALIVDLHQTLQAIPVAELSASAHDAFDQVSTTFERVDKVLAAAPIEQALNKLDLVSTRLDAVLSHPGIELTIENLAAVTGRLRKLAEDGDFDRMVKRIDETAERIAALVGDNQYDVRVIVDDLRVTANNLRILSETVKRYPAGALVGGPPDKIVLPGESR